MLNLKRLSIPLLISLTVPLAAAEAARAATLLRPSCTNLTEQECHAIEVLFGDAYATASGQPVVAEAKGAEAPAAPATDQVLEVSALRLALKIHVRGTLRRPDGAPIHSAEMTAASLDDMPPVAERISRALVHRTSVTQTRALDTISRTEAVRPNRIYSEKVIGFKTGLIQALSSETSFAPMIGLQFDARFEAETYFLEFGAGMMLPAEEEEGRGLGGLFAEFGASHYLGQGNVSPYLGGGVSPRILFTSADGGVRAAAYGQIGLMFMRFSSTRLYMELRVSQNLMGIKVFEDETSTSFSGDAKVSVYPTEVALQVGIGW